MAGETMGFFQKKRVNIVITNRVFRYAYQNTAKSTSETLGEKPFPEGVIKNGEIASRELFLETIHNIVKKHHWKGSNLYFSVPDDKVVIRQLQLPQTLTKDEAFYYIKTEFGNSIYLPFDNPAFDLELLDQVGEYRNALLFAYPKSKIDSFASMFKEAGLKAVAADLTSPSVYRYYYKHRQNKIKNVLHIHWNMEALSLTTYRNDQAIFSRYMELDYQAFMQESVLPLINDNILEIKRIIDFYQYSITKGEDKVELLLVTGDSPYLPQVMTTIKEAVPIPIFQFDEELPVKFIDVLGLALKSNVRKGEKE